MLEPGSRISHYRLEALLGAGGMGEVHAAFDEHLQRRVALKLLPAARALDVGARARMLREARAASALHHPGIVTIHEIGADESGRTFIVMELVEGETFAQLLARRGTLPAEEAVGMIAQVADAVGAAHEAGILHRDLKPANLMLDRRGRVKVLDFGLSKRVGPSIESSGEFSPRAVSSGDAPTMSPVSADAPTATPDPALDVTVGSGGGLDAALDVHTLDGARMGTPGYAALEMMRGELADARSDVFSLAVVLHELVAGALPYRATTWTELLAQLEAGRPASGPDPRLDAAIAPALHPDPAARYADVATLVAKARAAIAPPRRTRAPWYALGAGAVAAAGIAAFVLTRDRGGAAAIPPPAIDAAPALTVARTAADARALTTTGACAYSPAFADDDTIAFDLTRAGAVDLYSVPVTGGEPRVAVASTMMEWRSAPGEHPGEVVYLVTDTAENGLTYVDAVVLATGATRRLATLPADSVAMLGGALVYPTSVGPEVRTHTAERDELLVALPGEHAARLVTVSPDQRRIAIQTRVGSGSGALCIADLQDHRATCPVDVMLPSRPAWSADSNAVYYTTAAGIRRHALSAPDGDHDPVVVADAIAIGGIAASPDGRSLVWSTCGARGRIIAVADPERVLASADGAIDDLALGPDGSMTWVQSAAGVRAVMVRDKTGAVRELTGPADPTPRYPALSPDGREVAYVLGGESPGVYVQTLGAQLRAKPVALEPSASTPRWLDAERLAFQSWDERSVSWISVYDARDASVTRLAPRLLWGIHPRSGELLVSRDGEDGLFWRDLATRKERRWTPRGMPPKGEATGVSQSPSGRWLVIQAGQMSNRALRVDVLADAPTAELVYEAPQDVTVGRFAIDDDGRVYAAPNGWFGDLYALDGRF